MKDKSINLALQGGGAHGAFTWGVLDRLLHEPWLDIASVSGASAGALNGAALKAGLAAFDGPAGKQAARENLEALWSEVGDISDNRVIRWLQSLMPMPRGVERFAQMISPAAWMDGLTRIFSPYDYGPFYVNPLGKLMRDLPYPDFSCKEGPRLFVSATNVRTGRVKVFTGTQATPDAVMASACLPTLFQAIEITDPDTGITDAYWDGGYAANPALFPMYSNSYPRDIVVVALNPLMRDALPRTPVEIADRVNEISFNSSLMGQLRAINFVKRLFAEGRVEASTMKNVLVHLIDDDALMIDLTARSKLMPGPGMLAEMKKAGQAAADRFITDHADKLNNQDSFDLSQFFPAVSFD
ncbi:patatin-like phospholipase family protein [Paracoccus sp. JM45]|uniref:patatin-like phospholipase family protein n=1 Tax=Paracoccus sp. JM45 TaxID=2283626 RepID=UPI000E6D276D|nr:patatin-like phospholipase family protein [Paracoccus sp. JM45]RJE81316.1 patatin-like phospholipase family protein [Paracoccus sp. JM45]